MAKTDGKKYIFLIVRSYTSPLSEIITYFVTVQSC